MKNKVIFLFAFLLLVGSVIAAAPGNPYVVHGTAKVGGVIAPGMTITLTNLDTGDAKTTTSNSEGVFGFFLEQFPNGYSSGHALKYTYCISDTRCDQRDLTGFNVVGSGGLVKNIDASVGGAGGGVSYIVFGTITIDGSLKTSGVLTVENLRTTVTKDFDLDAEGFQFNLANFNEGYDTGDEIRLTFGTKHVSSFLVSGSGHEAILIFITPAEDSGDGGGSGSGGGKVIPTPPGTGTPRVEDPIETPDDEVVEPEDEINLPPKEETPVEEEGGSALTIIVGIIVLIGLGYVVYKFNRKEDS